MSFKLHTLVYSARNMHIENLNNGTLLLLFFYYGLQVSRVPTSVFLRSVRVQI